MHVTVIIKEKVKKRDSGEVGWVWGQLGDSWGVWNKYGQNKFYKVPKFHI